MPGDSVAGGAAFLNGEEVVNEARTIAYLNAGYGPPGLNVEGGCSCLDLRKLIGCDAEDYTIPAGTGDDHVGAAPWFDEKVPESADFAGFYPVEFTGMGSTVTRTTFPRITGGSVLGKAIPQERLLTWRGYLFGRTCCSVQYGLRWLTQVLVGLGCDCDNEDLDLLVCCPEVPEELLGNCKGLPSVQFSTPCDDTPGSSAFDAFRTLKSVGLVEGPKILSERKTGCRGGCKDNPNTPVNEAVSRCAHESCIIEVEFTLVAGEPYFYGCPITLCNKAPFPVGPEVVCPPGATKIGIGAAQPITTEGETCVNTCPEPADCGDDPACPLPTLPTIKNKIESACRNCDPLDPISICCSIDKDDFAEFFEGVPIVSIFSGRNAMRNTHIKFFLNPLEKPCNEVDKPCFECDSIHVRYIPPDSTLVINGLDRSITLKCPGNEEGSPADNLIVSPFTWSTLQCFNYCICVTTDGQFLDHDSDKPANVTVQVVPRSL